ncbi:hypothetical protein FRC08_011752 [Ceratobasidium sp. 394]|nr:hypothetical protein FRC08_011752 [Ceratobasidium sp. 394]
MPVVSLVRARSEFDPNPGKLISLLRHLVSALFPAHVGSSSVKTRTTPRHRYPNLVGDATAMGLNSKSLRACGAGILASNIVVIGRGGTNYAPPREPELGRRQPGSAALTRHPLWGTRGIQPSRSPIPFHAQVLYREETCRDARLLERREMVESVDMAVG